MKRLKNTTTNQTSHNTFYNRMCAAFLGSAFCVSVLLSASLPACVVHAEPTTGDGHPYDMEAEIARTKLEVQSNLISCWPQGPVISAESAMLMDVDTGTVLYAKNIHEKMYPASTTKMLTCLIAAEHLDLQDTVTFSYSAVHDVPPDGSNVGMDAGETITVEQCLNGILVGSANECASAIAEKVAGSVEAFTQMMNERAQELGCTESHFVNANGLFDENHYTSAHDLCLIGRAFFANETLSQVGNTPRYHFVATATQPDDFWITNKHKLINGEYSYPGVLGGKTGYTSQSKETLVTGCERGAMKLVCVVMKEDDPKQFEDTVTLLDYGFSNFTKVDAAEYDTGFSLKTGDLFHYGMDLYGDSNPAFSIAPDSFVDLPNTASFQDVQSDLGTDNIVRYRFGEGDQSVVIGEAPILIHLPQTVEEEPVTRQKAVSGWQEKYNLFWDKMKSLYVTDGFGDVIYVNVISCAVTALLLFLILILFMIAHRIHLRRTRARRYAYKRQRRRGRGSQSRGRGRGKHRIEYQDDYYDQHRYDRYNNDDWDSY